MINPILVSAILIAATLITLLLSPLCHADDNILYSGIQVLEAGQSLKWNTYILTMQNDCNLVLYQSKRPVWATDTGGLSYDCHLVLQADGNLIIYNPDLNQVWASNKGGVCGNYVLVLQKDRNVVVYSNPIWSSKSNKAIVDGKSIKLQQDSTAANNVLYSGDQVGSTLLIGQSLTWGTYSLVLQIDCNLVLYDSGRPIWATNTGGRSVACHLKLESNGNLVVYGALKNVLWESHSRAKDGHYVLVLQKDRNLVIYGDAQWASGSDKETFGMSSVSHFLNTNAEMKQIKAAADEKLSVTQSMVEKSTRRGTSLNMVHK